MGDKIIIEFHILKKKQSVDLEIPSDITARELAAGLNEAFSLGISTTDAGQGCLRSENPIALLRGNRLLSEYGLRNGSIVYYAE